MALIVKKPKGTEDIVPSKVYKWHTVEKIVSEAAEIYGFKEIRVPTFEETGLFVRSVGETTDVVQKEMYSVSAAGDSKFTLRPEGTSGTMRAVLENGIMNEGLPQKVYYILSFFRHENTQKGRLREFHQFGCEMVGSESPRADAEVISLAKSVLDRAGLRNIKLNINSIGCPTCRAEYRKALKEYFAARKDQLCETCRDRLDKNPMRILDCKNKNCGEITKNAPIILDYMCEECDSHFAEVKKYLDILNIPYTVDPGIVRGLDYYTKTIFEILNDDFTVCGGGRYDRLIEQLGGPEMPAVGFALGIERLLLTLKNEGIEIPSEGLYDLYVGARGEEGKLASFKLANTLRTRGIKTEINHMGRSLKAEMKYANKIGAKFTVVLGDDELQTGNAKLKRMSDGEQFEVNLNNIEEIVAILNS